MTLIDWSDSEGIFGLLLDFVADERAECQEDLERQGFLADVLAQLETVGAEFPEIPAAVVIQKLRDTHDSVDAEFASDPVVVHIQACIEELERVESGIA